MKARTVRAGVRVRVVVLLAVLLLAGLSLAGQARLAVAHVVPTSHVQLSVLDQQVSAQVSIPLSDLEAASGLDLGDQSAAAVDAQAGAVRSYLAAHFAPSSTTSSGAAMPWVVEVGALTVVEAGDAATTGMYQQLIATVVLSPPAEADARSFDLGYTAVVDTIATHVVIVTVHSDWAGGHPESSYEVGVVKRDTVTNRVVPLHVDLGSGSAARGFASMVSLGVAHIAEGTDHQLFLLTLLLPAPLLIGWSAAGRRRWSGPVPVRRAIRRIGAVTIAFTAGHSVTLALGALGVPVPQTLVESAIALSILVAAVHAIRPLFPGREALVAAGFGLVHGLAFSQTLQALDLSGRQLVLSLLGFNLGIELMQLVVVALVLPPLILLARAGTYTRFRVVASALTGVAAIGWLVARLGAANPVAELADQLGETALPVVIVLWVTSGVLSWRARGRDLAALRSDPGRGQTVGHAEQTLDRPDHVRGAGPLGGLAQHR